MVLLTGLLPKSMFGLFDHCATRKVLKNPRLMAGFKASQRVYQRYKVRQQWAYIGNRCSARFFIKKTAPVNQRGSKWLIVFKWFFDLGRGRHIRAVIVSVDRSSKSRQTSTRQRSINRAFPPSPCGRSWSAWPWVEKRVPALSFQIWKKKRGASVVNTQYTVLPNRLVWSTRGRNHK